MHSSLKELISVNVLMLNLIGKCLHFLLLAESGTEALIVKDKRGLGLGLSSSTNLSP